MRLNLTPGLYELIETGDGTAATLVAAMIAKEALDPYWISSPQADAPEILRLAGCNPWYEVVSRAYVALTAVRGVDEACPGEFDLFVIDCLADMRGTHPEARTIAADVKRAVIGWKPAVPVLVVNNWREPAPPGGVYWRGRVNTRVLDVLREEPLIAHLDDFQEGCPPLFLVWYPNYRPELRPLKPIEWRYFFPDGVPGWEVHFQLDRPATVTPTGQRQRRAAWLIERSVR
jgi:hypothetical protein